VLGLCAGYQMLGWRVNTKQAIGLLPISSTVQPAECKLIDRMKGQLYPSGVHVDGFEINCGFSEVVHSEQNNVAHGKYHGISPLLAYEDGKSMNIYKQIHIFCHCYYG
ncbi:MAG: cobyric acid synthase, partial [Bacillariaceae sp.]|jgi:cobyric acid synthase